MCVWKSCGWVWLFPISKKYLFHLFDIDTSHSKFFKKLIVSLSNMAESEVGFWSAEVEVTFEDLDFDKSWTTGSVDCLPSSLLPVGTEIKVNSVLPFQNLSSARFGSSEVFQSSSITCSVLSSKVTKVFRSCAIFSSSTGLSEVLPLNFVISDKRVSGSIKVPSISMIVNWLETRSWFSILWFELLMESHTNRFEVNRIKNLKWGVHKQKRTMTIKWDLTTTWWFQNHFLWAKFNLITLIQKSSYWNQWVVNVSHIEVQVEVTITWFYSNKFPTINFQWLTCHATKWGFCYVPVIGKSGHSGAKFLGQQLAAAPLSKRIHEVSTVGATVKCWSMKTSSKSGSLTWFKPTLCKVSKWSLSFREYWEVGYKFEQPWEVGVTTGPTSTELPTPRVPKLMAAINKDLLREVFPCEFEVLSSPGGGPEVTAETLAPEPEVLGLELASSATVTEVLFWLSWSVGGEEEVGSFQDEVQLWSQDQSSPQEVHSQSSYHQLSKSTFPTYHSSFHEVSSFSATYVSLKSFEVSFSFHSSCHEVSVHGLSSTAFTLLKLLTLTRSVTRLSTSVANYTFAFAFVWSLTFSFAFHSFEVLSFSFSFALTSFPFMKFQWLNPFPFLYSYLLWSFLCLLVLLCPWAQVLNPKKSRCACSWSTAPGCFSSGHRCW